MAGPCKPVVDYKEIMEERAEDFSKIDTMINLLKNDPMVRLGLGIPVDKKSNVKYEFSAWAKMRFGVDPMREVLDTPTINHLFAELIRIRKQMTSGQRVFTEKSHLKAFLHKMFHLPQRVFEGNIVGGEDLWLSTQILKHRADDLRIKINTQIESMGESFRDLTSVTAKAVDRVVGEAETKLTAALDRQKLLTTVESTRQEKTDARMDVENARQELNAIYRGDIADKQLGNAVRLQRSLVLMLNGNFATYDSAGNEIIRPLKIREVIEELPTGKEISEGSVTKTKKVLDSEGLLQALMKSNPNLDLKSARKAGGLMEQVTDFLVTFGESAKAGFEAERKNLYHELTRGESMLSHEEAMGVLDKVMKYEEVDLYFPQRALSHMSRLQSIVNGVKTAADKKAYLRGVIQHGDQVIFKGEGTPHTRKRILDYQQRDVSMNMFRVLSDYSNEIVTYWHDNKLSEVLNRYTGKLWKVRNTIVDEKQLADFEAYIQGVQSYLTEFAEVSKNAPTGGKLHEASSIVTAMYAITKMGLLNPSTPALNFGEGHAVLMTRVGFDRMFITGTRKDLWKTHVEPLISGEFTDIMPGEQFMDYSAGSHSKLVEFMSDVDAKRFAAVEKDHTLLRMQKTRAAISKVATEVIKPQTWVENVNRSRSFRAGATLEYEFIQGKFMNTFFSGDANKLLTDADVRMMFGDSSIREIRRSLGGSMESRKKLWNRFAKKRVIKAGYEMMYQTQWNYNQAARHFLERSGPIPKLAMMFQHYPLSWIAAWQRTYTILDSLKQAGGAKAMFSRDPKQRAIYDRRGKLSGTLGEKAKGLASLSSNLGYWTNREMMFALSAGIVSSVVAGLRYGSGVVMGQFWQHPLTEVAGDIVRYVQNGFNGEEEQNKRLFWGRGMLNEFTGPFYSDFMDAVSLASMKVGIDDGDMPRWVSDLLRGTMGYRPNELLLTQYGARRFGNVFDVVNESFLFGSMSVAPKAARMATSIPRMGDEIYDAGVGKTYEALTGGKLHRKEDPDMNDFAGQVFRAFGIRSEKDVEEYLEKRLKKEYKQ